MKTKVSATVDEHRLAEAKRLTGCSNVSSVLDQALEALIVALLERTHTEGYERLPQGDEVVSLPDAAVWLDLPWDDEPGEAGSPGDTRAER